MSHVQRRGAIVWAVPRWRLSDHEIDELLAELEVHLAGATPYVLLFDLTRAGTPNALQRQKLAMHMRNNTSRIRLTVRGVGVILQSSVARGNVTAIFWIAPPPVPHRLFTTPTEATEWADSLIQSAP
jgi:hypothetical protein